MAAVALLWKEVCQTLWESEALIFVLGSALVFTASFWLTAGLFLIVDLSGRPSWILHYKVQPNKNTPVSLGQVKKVLHCAIFNQFLIGVPCMVLVYPAQVWMGMNVLGEVPTVSHMIVQVLVFAIIEEIGFYYSHRLLHHPQFYKTVHKQHHEWTAPIAVVAMYAHPIEFVLSNVLPLVAGPLLCGAHPVTSWLWYSIASVFTVIHHSGYHLPGLPSPEFHDYHHLKFNQNYGVLGLLDWLHGTDLQFRQSKQFTRHTVIFSLALMKPDTS